MQPLLLFLISKLIPSGNKAALKRWHIYLRVLLMWALYQKVISYFML